MRFLQRNHIVPPISINITPFLHNLPIMLTMNANHLDITAEHNEDRFRTMYKHDSGVMNISAVIKKPNFALEATVESTPKRGLITVSPESTTTATQPQQWILQILQQCVLWNEISDQRSLLAAYS